VAWFGAAIAAFGHLSVEAPTPCAVIARVGARRPRAITSELAKALLDALHDRKHNPPSYRSAAATAPLVDDDPTHVSALAIELSPAEADTVRFTLASAVRSVGEPLANVALEAEAPNDVAASSREEAKRVVLRRGFAEALYTGWPKAGSAGLADASCLIIRHGPQRDEDNTWATWVGVLTRGGAWLEPVVPSALAQTWRPTAIASIADPQLAGRVVFEFYR
jgi:hypothetical protein